MSKKNFKIDLDDLMSTTGMSKEEVTPKKIELSSEEKHWLLVKIDRLNQELHLWRTGNLNEELFHESLKKNKLSYDAEKNEIR